MKDSTNSLATKNTKTQACNTQIKVLLRIINFESKLVNTWFTDERWFILFCLHQIALLRKRMVIIGHCPMSKEAVKPMEFQEHAIKVHMWSAISVRGIIGPYIFR